MTKLRNFSMKLASIGTLFILLICFHNCQKSEEGGTSSLDEVDKYEQVEIAGDTIVKGQLRHNIPPFMSEPGPWFDEYKQLRKDINERFEKNEFSSQDSITPFKLGDEDYIFGDYQLDKRVFTCSVVPYKEYKKAASEGAAFVTDCDGFNVLDETSSVVVGRSSGNSLYFTKAGYNIGTEKFGNEIWDRLRRDPYGTSAEENKAQKVGENVAILTYTDFGYSNSDLLGRSLDRISQTYGAVRIYNPEKNVVVFETEIDIPEKDYDYYRNASIGAFPRKYYGFSIIVNNRLEIRGQVEIGYPSKSQSFDFQSFNRKVAFYKNYLSSVDYQKLASATNLR
jgi:hypothetical protein